MGKKKTIKLRTNLLLIIVFAWLIPFVLIVSFIIIYTYREISIKTENSIIISMDAAVDSSMINMENCVLASKTASYLPTIRSVYENYKKDDLEEILYEKTNIFLDQQYKFDKRFTTAMIYYPELSKNTYYTYNTQGGGSYKKIKYYEENVRKELPKISEKIGTSSIFYNIEGNIYLIRNIMDSNYNPYAVIIMEINQKEIFENLKSVWGNKKEVIYKNGDFLYGNISIEYDSKMKNIKGFSNFEKEKMRVWKTIRYEGDLYTYIVEIDEKVLLTEIEVLGDVIIIFFIFILFLAFLLFGFFGKKVTKPIEKLVISAKEIEKGNYGYNVLTDYRINEFVYLEKSFNDMSNELEKQFKTIFLEELALKNAEIKALQSQINPHFLNNTLEIINWEARLEENYKVSKMIESLSTILGATMNRDKRKLVSLSEELSYVDSYLYIIATRLGDRFCVKKEIDETLMQEQVPKLIIQPIIENAVEHGINEQNSGEIIIKIYARNEILYIQIINNGKLKKIDRERIENLLKNEVNENLTEFTRVGIHNVHKRLRMLYGEPFGLTVKSNNEDKTISTIKVKINKKKINEQEKTNNNNTNH